MLPFQTRLEAFKELGRVIANLEPHEQNFHSQKACTLNTWFSKDSITQIFKQVVFNLSVGQLEEWVSNYTFREGLSRKIGVISAGNIPLASFQDWVCVLMSGHILALKTSQRDTYLIKFLTDKLLKIEPKFKNYILFTDELKDCEAFITSSSSNTARYFRYYFGKYPHIIRQHRTSCAVLNGEENEIQLRGLAEDMFLYFGLGCRSISKLYLPENFDLEKLLTYWQSSTKALFENHKYRNNYDYNKALFLVNRVEHLDNGYVLFKRDSKLASPIAVVYYDYYANLETLKQELETKQTEIQCIATSSNLEGFNCIDFGTAQLPNIWDYPDKTDTLKFLSKIK